MRRYPARAVRALTALLAVGALPAQTPATPLPEDDEALIATLEAEIAALNALSWTPSTSVVTSVGWRDNVLLSAFNPIARAFGRAEVEAVLLRPPRHRWEFMAFLNGEVLRYFSPPPDTKGEQRWGLHQEIRWTPVDPVRLALKAVGYWQDAVIDLSETEVLRFVAPARVRGGYVSCTPRFTLPAGLRLEPAVQVKRNHYRGYGGDYDELKGSVRLEWRPSAALNFSTAWSGLGRKFEQRTQYTAGGRPLPGKLLHLRQREIEVMARATWGRHGTWTAAASAAHLANDDQASGYFDLAQKRATVELEWRRAAGRVVAWLEGARTVYRTQTVGTGIAPPARLAEDFETVLRGERTLNPNWLVFTEHRWERSRSNLPDLGFRVTTLIAGARRSF